MKNLYFALVLSLYFSNVFGQQSKIDSLHTELSKTNIDTVKANILGSIAKEVYYTDTNIYRSIVDSMFFYSKKAKSKVHVGRAHNALGRYYQRVGIVDSAANNYRLAANINKQTNQTKDLAISLGNLGGVYLNTGQSDSAIFYLKKALKINKMIESDEGQFFNYLNLSIIEEDNAVDNTLNALKYAEKTKNQRFISYCQSQLGVLYLYQGVYQESEKYLKKALITFDELDDYGSKASQYVNLGKLYNERDNDFQKAISYYQKAVINYDKVKNNRDKSTALANIGRNYIKLSVLDSAQIYLNESLILSNETEYIQEKGRIYANLGEIALNKNLLSRAKKNILEALKISQKGQFLEDESDALLLLSDIYSKQGKYKNALDAYISSTSITDSIRSIDKLEKIAELNTKYETEKKERELVEQKNATQEQELLTQKANTQKWLFLLFSIIAILSLLLYVKYAKFKKRQLLYNSRLDVIKAKQNEQEEIGIELHDNVSKKLESISIALKKDGKTELANQTITIKNKIRKLSKELSAISFEESSFKEQIITLASGYQHEELKIHIKGLDDILWSSIDSPIKYNLFLIIREAISNSYNHSDATNILLDIKQDKKDISIRIQDNGIGFDENTVSYNRGFRNMKIRVKDINGILTVKSQVNKGTQIFIQLALA